MLNRLDRKWIRILLYYLVALAFSFLARFYWHTSDPTDPDQGIWAMYWHLVGAIGPFLGALAIWTLFEPERRISFGGTWPPMGAAMLAVPVIVMGVIGIANPFAINPHLFGVHMALWIALYAVLEETGWRGYLQGEFADRPALLRYAIVGVFWYAWHFSYLGDHTLGSEIASLIFIVLASIGIGFVADRTRSIFAAASFHIIGNILTTTTDFRTFVPSQHARTIIVLACVAIWLVMLRIWAIRDGRLRRAVLA